MKKSDKENLIFYMLDKTFKGLDKEYMLDCMFDESIQRNWKPQTGDIIIGSTGNIFVISGIDRLHETLGGDRYYFGGGSCNRDGGNVLNETYCFTANESGNYIDPLKGERSNSYHSSIKDFKYVPYPHERK